MQDVSNKTAKPVIVSVASHGREDYNKAMLSLIDTKVKHCNDYDMLLFSVDGKTIHYNGHDIKIGSWPITESYGPSDSQKNNPYQFKPFAIMAAIELGYRQIIWCDSTIRINNNPDDLWPIVLRQGILSWDNLGFPLEEWITDQALQWVGVSSAKNMKQIMACCIMFDLNNPIARLIVTKWIESSIDGCFKSLASSNPLFKETRHDQSMLSLLLNINNVPIEPYGVLAYRNYMPCKPTFINWGVE